jgi:hypothetical protein
VAWAGVMIHKSTVIITGVYRFIMHPLSINGVDLGVQVLIRMSPYFILSQGFGKSRKNYPRDGWNLILTDRVERVY